MILPLFAALTRAEPAGTYAFEMRTVTAATVPVIGEVEAVTLSRMIAVLTEGPGGLSQSHRVCDVQIQGATDLARTVLPRAFIEAIPEARYSVGWSVEGGIGRYEADLGVMDVGFNATLSGGGLPAPGAEAGVVDWEGDGLPGATVRVEIPVFRDVDIYLVQRSRAVLRGQLHPDGSISGQALLVDFGQSVLGATHSLFDRAPHIVPLVDRGSFTLSPISPGSGCEVFQ